MGIGSSTHTGSDVAIYVKRQFGDESGTQISNDDIVRWINIAQLEICQQGEVNRTKATTPSVAGQQAYTFSGQAVLRVLAVWYDGVPLESTTFEQAQKTLLDVPTLTATSTVYPYLWYEYGDSLYLYPTPQASGKTITLFLVKSPDPLVMVSSALTIPDTHYTALLSSVMRQAYELDEDYSASQLKATQFGEQLAAGYNTATEDVYPTITVLPEDAW